MGSEQNICPGQDKNYSIEVGEDGKNHYYLYPQGSDGDKIEAKLTTLNFQTVLAYQDEENPKRLIVYSLPDGLVCQEDITGGGNAIKGTYHFLHDPDSKLHPKR